MRYFFLIGAQFILCYSFAQNSLGFSFEEDKDYVELSFKDESNLIVVPILVNGEGPFNFILDSGSESGMIFDRFVISQNNLVNARTIPIYARDGKKITDLLVANNIDIQLSGGVRGIQQSMVVLQEKDLVDIQSVLGVNAHGVLGSELFNRFVIEIDYENKKLRLYEPEKFEKPKGFKTVPIRIKNSRPYLSSKIKQPGNKKKNVNLLMDTGASSALFLDAEGYDDINVPRKSIEYILGGSLAGTLNGQVGRIKGLQIGKFNFKNVVTSFPESWQIKREIGTGGDSMKRHGTIGSDILSRFTVIFDYMNSSIYLKKTKGYRKRFRFNTSGLTLNTSDWDNKRLFVSSVIPGSPAEKVGIQAGDEIMSINDKPVFFYSFSDIVGFIRAVPGETLTLILMRDGKYFPRRIKLRKII